MLIDKLTNNISRHEITCKCGCGFDVADFELITAVQDAADFFMHRENGWKVAIIITSGNRCVEHNRKIGGSDNSQHLYGKAMDFKLKVVVHNEWRFVSEDDLYSYLDSKYPEKFGIGLYCRGRCHVDVRANKVRWRG